MRLLRKVEAASFGFGSSFHGCSGCIHGNYSKSDIWLAGKSSVEKEAKKERIFYTLRPSIGGLTAGQLPQEYEEICGGISY